MFRVNLMAIDAEIDHLTDLPTTVRLEQLLAGTLPTPRHREYTTAVIVVDIDNFKRYNRKYGEPQGDEALQTVASYLRVQEERDQTIFGAGRIQDKINKDKDYFWVVVESLPKDELVVKAEQIKAGLNRLQIERKGVPLFSTDDYKRITVDVVFSMYTSDMQEDEALSEAEKLAIRKQFIQNIVENLNDKSLRRDHVRFIPYARPLTGSVSQPQDHPQP